MMRWATNGLMYLAGRMDVTVARSNTAYCAGYTILKQSEKSPVPSRNRQHSALQARSVQLKQKSALGW
jgi:hypothetical protein